MKHLIYILLLCTFSAANADEITYYNATWAEIKAKAKTEHKYIMVDCYTDWCGWCKVMEKKTMPDPCIIALMNEKFIAVKMDMEHGEGVTLAMKYHISGYPTFMFFNPAGEIVYISVGYQEPKGFLKELNSAMDKNIQFNAPGYSASINIDFPDLYKMAFAENGKKKFPDAKEVATYLDKQTDLFSEANWGVLCRFDAGEKYMRFFLDNIEKYTRLYGNYYVNEKVVALLYSQMNTAVKNNDKEKISDILKMTDQYVKNDAPRMKMDLKMEFYKGTKDWNNFADAFNEYITKTGYDNADFINSTCWNIYENCDNKKMLTEACTYMEKTIAIAPQYAYMDTYAALLYKTGQMKEAETWANKAIATGKKNGDKTSSTEELLKKITAHK